MNTRFKSALNHVKADEELISKTEEYLRDTFAKEQNSRMNEFKTSKIMDMKKFAIAACMAILLIGGGAKVYATPVSYVSVDINPSVELGINAFGRVITAEGYNKDGNTILSGVRVKGKNVKEAVSAVVDSATHKGFIEKDGSTVVSITAETDNASTAAKLKAEAQKGAKEALMENDESADVNSDNIALARRNEARTLGITPGKLNLIQKLQAVDPTATVDQYKDAKARDIMKAIQENNDNGIVNNNDNGAANNKINSSINSRDRGSINGNHNESGSSKQNGSGNRKDKGSVNRKNNSSVNNNDNGAVDKETKSVKNDNKMNDNNSNENSDN